jgi:hypothetical protein
MDGWGRLEKMGDGEESGMVIGRLGVMARGDFSGRTGSLACWDCSTAENGSMVVVDATRN